MTAKEMVRAVRKATGDWRYSAVSIGYPGPVLHGKPVSEPRNLGEDWLGFDFTKAFGCPVRLINDAAMQALGSYKGGRMLFLGLGTGLGSALTVEGVLEPMELAHLPYKHGRTYEEEVGEAALKHFGKKKWRRHVADVIRRLQAALEAGDVVGGGNAKKLKKLPEGVRLGSNANAFIGRRRPALDLTKGVGDLLLGELRLLHGPRSLVKDRPKPLSSSSLNCRRFWGRRPIKADHRANTPNNRQRPIHRICKSLSGLSRTVVGCERAHFNGKARSALDAGHTGQEIGFVR
jgi:polyphosphate glucokinase